MTVAHYIRQVLVNPLSGYYMHGDVFGQQGDFVTSPEISQMFGELCGIWYLTEWMRLGKPAKTQIIEFGPGRGTLMSDMIRTWRQFPYFYKTISGIHLIEASPGLRKMQRANLVQGSLDTDVKRIETKETAGMNPTESISTQDGIKISWHDGIELVPEQWSFIMAHEFFDALPVHSFEKTSEGWRELLVDIDDTNETEYNFRLVRSPADTMAGKFYMKDETYTSYKVGDRIEISPDSWTMATQMAKLVNTHGGSGLLIDYGQDYAQGDTLRAIRKHKFVHPMTEPGSADLSVDVDFNALKVNMRKDTDISVHGPVTQSEFLQSLGIQVRMEMLLKNATSRASRNSIIEGFKRLLDPSAMGRIYKVLAFSNESTSTEEAKPVGFHHLE
ncbi:S-adenosyl-L-methionine-dependent methyltransferase [Halteromyces radiatus]|uniref:S-adenosyl-L-methionine-dependent methyltransferase n=1 Tax=Halteromyces radiatus TaxID=101107 RepID=UPI00221FA855|nr:S-adenosyl-L-methionine-dependent methyltransferase [Halteromyces radiatus]KAI8093839.1 S-adenosyl-L-methionine-dependent methyltransferase [Halteromyces radiatus]